VHHCGQDVRLSGQVEVLSWCSCAGTMRVMVVTRLGWWTLDDGPQACVFEPQDKQLYDQDHENNVPTTATDISYLCAACLLTTLRTCSCFRPRRPAARVPRREPRATRPRTVREGKTSSVEALLTLCCFSSLQERQRLPALCRRRGARACSLGQRPAGMGRLHLVPGAAPEGQCLCQMHLHALMSLCIGPASAPLGNRRRPS
jgi:hypothetical protein